MPDYFPVNCLVGDVAKDGNGAQVQGDRDGQGGLASEGVDVVDDGLGGDVAY